jgi:hypothetical protein
MTSIFPSQLTPLIHTNATSTPPNAPTDTAVFKPLSAPSNTPRVDEYPSTPKTVVGYKLPPHHSPDDALLQFSNSPSSVNQYDALFLGGHRFGSHSLSTLAQRLKQDHTVKHLILPNTHLNDHAIISEFAKAGLADLLKVNHTIGWLVLNGNLITDIGAKALADALHQNKGVKHLILSDNQIGDDGVIALAQLLKETTTLHSLFLQGNPFGCKALTALIIALPHAKSLKTLNLQDCHCQDLPLKTQLITLAKRLGISLKI